MILLGWLIERRVATATQRQAATLGSAPPFKTPGSPHRSMDLLGWLIEKRIDTLAKREQDERRIAALI